MAKAKRIVTYLLIGWIFSGIAALPARAAELDPETVVAFNQYIHFTELRMEDDQRDNHFLYIDSMLPERRAEIEARVRRGELYIEQLHTTEDGRPIRAPKGLIHHWIGIAFIPRDAFSQTLNVLRDYEEYVEVYNPDVQLSKLLELDGNISKSYFRLYKKSLVTVVLNANFNEEYRSLSSTRAELWSHSTRIAEVRDPSGPNETELPVGNDHGYLWRMNSYWRIEQKDGGVYLQVESVALSRTVPPLIAWLVNPTIRNLAREVIADLLNATVKAALKKTPSDRFLKQATQMGN